MQSRRVFVFGGTGQSGQVLLNHLVKKGVDVIAGTRNPQKAPKIGKVKWVKVDVRDKSTYIQYFKNVEVVLSCLGSAQKKKVDLYSKGYPIIMEAMQQAKVHRLILVTARHEADAGWFYRTFIKPMLQDLYDDIARLDQYLKSYKGPIKFTDIRPMRFTDGKRKKHKIVQAWTPKSQKFNFQTNVEDIAELAIKAWEQNLYLGKFIDIGEEQS